jgi:propionyl-CoA synthetase
MSDPETIYAEARDRWRSDPESWWRDASLAVTWTKPPDKIFEPSEGPYGRWFPDAQLNISANCLDRHVAAGRGGQDALLWDSPMAGETRRYTYEQLLDCVARFAGALRAAGVAAGDRVLIYMPMIPEAVIAMLASARIGAIHSVVFGGFAPSELATRIADATPKVVVTASCGIEPGRTIDYLSLLNEALSLGLHAPACCFVVQRPMLRATLNTARDRDFADALRAEAVDPVAVDACHPLYILYTSGTSGKPKGIVRDCGGYAVALLESLRMIYGVAAGDVVWTASDIGWVVGHSYIVYGPLLAGCTTILYEGKPVGTPDAGAFWRVCATYGAKILFTAPTAIRAIRQQDPGATFMRAADLRRLEAVFLAGERCDPSTAEWLGDALQRPIIDHWWQTETGWPITAGFRGFGLTRLPSGSGGRAAPGWTVAAKDVEGATAEASAQGDLLLKLPLPPGAATTLWRNDAGFVSTYLTASPGWYATGDVGRVDENGNVWVMGRSDDIINVAGHRLSTGAMEEVLAAHPSVVECVVVGLSDPIKGQVPVGLYVVKRGASGDLEKISAELVAMVRDRIGPVAAMREALPIARLPKTRSGKFLRKVIRQIGDGERPIVPSTIEDAGALDDVRLVLAGRRKGTA